VEDEKENKKKAHQLFTNLWKINPDDLFRYEENKPIFEDFKLSQYLNNKHENGLLSDIIEEDLENNLHGYESEFDPNDTIESDDDDSNDEYGIDSEDSFFLVELNSIKKTKDHLEIIFENESSLIKKRYEEEDEEKSSNDDSCSPYKKSKLALKTSKELKSILQEFKVRLSGTKKDLIQRIITVTSNPSTEVERIY
jgi:uncharacterized protein YdcH (DUF465 family)